MNIAITGHQLDVTDALKKYAHSKLERLVSPFEQVIDVHVILGTEKHAQHAEATINIRGKRLFAKAEGQDAYAAIDGLVDKLSRQLMREKERKHDHRGAAAPEGLDA